MALSWFPFYAIETIDAILITHGHADAILGFDDLRQWTLDGRVHASIPVYLNSETMKVVARTFPYLVDSALATGGGQIAALQFHVFGDNDHHGGDVYSPLLVDELKVIPFDVEHGKAGENPYYSLGYKFPGITYISDANLIPKVALDLIADSDILVLDALNVKPHPSHMMVDEAIQIALNLKPRLLFLTDFCHDVEHYKLEKTLREHQELKIAGVSAAPAFDGLVVELNC
ncbi:hypothetical protein HK100_008918 [Physocladia obscura]|uniref:Metallo-beta-lactamase domain-containing protein n=1 Tax=Physocladia obscura TaxID=109957 RepID=A0AAD5XBB1_9FUNG|nr:hypothetical protein HK100_008918 [Physocladia obscura]